MNVEYRSVIALNVISVLIYLLQKYQLFHTLFFRKVRYGMRLYLTRDARRVKGSTKMIISELKNKREIINSIDKVINGLQ